ncbi:winged helix-turn-helix domain-containing protein [Microbacterium sp. P04]|uniref:winged helix-turn-helix domain-containing protein n=1 Tax=Microbacterium sp. P04 TaxID=3366947 RepID=UPI003746E76D
MSNSLAPIFRSDSQLLVLDAILNLDGPLSTSEVVHRTGLSQPLAHRELGRMIDAGIFAKRRFGRSDVFEPNESNPVTPHLRALTTIVLGPERLLREALQDVPGIEQALIFGSFAARAAGHAGANPNDIDVLIVGTPERSRVYEAIDKVETQVRRDLHVLFLRPERWERGDEELVRRA